MQPAIDIVLGYRDYQTEIRFDHFALGLFHFCFGSDDCLLTALDIDRRGCVPSFSLANGLSKSTLLLLKLVYVLSAFILKSALDAIYLRFGAADLFDHSINGFHKTSARFGG